MGERRSFSWGGLTVLVAFLIGAALLGLKIAGIKLEVGPFTPTVTPTAAPTSTPIPRPIPTPQPATDSQPIEIQAIEDATHGAWDITGVMRFEDMLFIVVHQVGSIDITDEPAITKAVLALIQFVESQAPLKSFVVFFIEADANGTLVAKWMNVCSLPPTVQCNGQPLKDEPLPEGALQFLNPA